MGGTSSEATPSGGKKQLSWQNLGIGAAIQVFEVSTLGQPFEVVKTHMAAHRSDTLREAIRKTYYQRGGIAGFYQGLIPWAWIEASTKGAVLLFSSSEIEYVCRNQFGLSPAFAGFISGMGGGVCQAYTTMGFCTFMKTVEVTRHKEGAAGNVSSISIARDILKREGIVGLNRGVSAVALRQMTNWGSRIGISRLTERAIRGDDKDRKMTVWERLLASVIGGALACWNQPIEVIRVEMQSQVKKGAGQGEGKRANSSIWSTAKHIYENNGLKGFYRGITPRIGLSVYLTVCMVFGGDSIKERFK